MSEAKFPGSAPEVDPQIAELAQAIATEPAGDALRERAWSAIVADAPVHSTRPRWSWAVGGVTLATATLVGISFLLLPGSPTNPTVSMAQVEQAMRQINTATWNTTYTQFHNGAEIQRNVTETWVRLAPPAIAERPISAWRSTLGPYRVTTEEGITAYYKDSNRYEIVQSNLQPGETMREIVQEHIESQINPPKTDPMKEKYWKISLPPRIVTPWKSERVRRDGKELLRFYANVRPGPPRKGYTASWRLASTDWSIWIDPKTRLVARMETRTKDDGWDSLQVTEGYRYNEEPPANAFDLKPTPGAKVTYQDWRSHEVQLTDAQRKAIQTTIAESEAGWVAGDFDRFVRSWDLAYDRPQPNTVKTYRSEAFARQSWNGIVSDQKGRWQYWKSEIPSEAIAIRHKGYEGWTAIPAADPDILEIRVITRAAFARGKDRSPKAWDTRYYLRPDGDGYKIVHYSYRWPFSTWDGTFRPAKAKRSGTPTRREGRR